MGTCFSIKVFFFFAGTCYHLGVLGQLWLCRKCQIRRAIYIKDYETKPLLKPKPPGKKTDMPLQFIFKLRCADLPLDLGDFHIEFHRSSFSIIHSSHNCFKVSIDHQAEVMNLARFVTRCKSIRCAKKWLNLLLMELNFQRRQRRDEVCNSCSGKAWKQSGKWNREKKAQKQTDIAYRCLNSTFKLRFFFSLGWWLWGFPWLNTDKKSWTGGNHSALRLYVRDEWISIFRCKPMP